MRAQIVAILLAAVVCCKANYLPVTLGLGGSNYAGSLGYPSSAYNAYSAPYNAYAAPYNTYAAAAYNPTAAVKVINVAPSDLGNYIIVSDVAGVAPAVAPAASYAVAPAVAPAASYAVAPAVAPAASYAVVDPTTSVIKDAVSRYVAPLRSYGNFAYVVKK